MATTVIGARDVRPARFWASTNGKKAVMAVTGFILFLFIIAHVIGNLQVFEGPAQINAYGRYLRAVPEILWAYTLSLHDALPSYRKSVV